MLKKAIFFIETDTINVIRNCHLEGHTGRERVEILLDFNLSTSLYVKIFPYPVIVIKVCVHAIRGMFIVVFSFVDLARCKFYLVPDVLSVDGSIKSLTKSMIPF